MNELYQTAAQLYANSLRAMEQRSSSFLILQSILVGAFAILLNYFLSTNDINSLFPTLGIALVGLVISVVFLKAHKVTSLDVSYWRAYMRLLEDKDIENKVLWQQPWHLLYEYAKELQRERWNLLYKFAKRLAKRLAKKQLFSYQNTLERLPGPLLWLGFPVIFLTAWIVAIVWVYFLEYSRFISIEQFYIIVAILCSIAGGLSVYKWVKSKDNTYNKLTGIANKWCKKPNI